MAELQRSIEFPTLHVVEERPSWAEPVDELRYSERMRNLGVVLERLWRFYQAMHDGKPLEKSDKVLPQMGNALKNAVLPGEPR